jgi:hypothetical protein
MEEKMIKEVELNKEKDNLNIEKPIEEKVEPVVEEKAEPVVEEKAEPVVEEKVKPVVDEKSDELIEDKKKLETAKSKGILSRVRNFFKRK